MAVVRQVAGDRIPGRLAPELPDDQISINEIYASIQGECRHMGRPTTFVRMSHCPLRCTWCDSKYTFNEGRAMGLDAVLDRCDELAPNHVCLTGGEPLAQPQAVVLVQGLVERGRSVEIETSGSEDITPVNALPSDVRSSVTVNLDIKCPMSAMTAFNRWENLDLLDREDQVKFVVGDRADYEYARSVIARHHQLRAHVWMNPVWGVLEPTVIAQWVADDGLDVRVGVQLHKILWGDRRGI